MKRMIEKKFANEDLDIELTSYIDDKQNVLFGSEERILLRSLVIVNQRMLLRDMYPKTIKYAKLSGTPFQGVRSKTHKPHPVKRRVKVDGVHSLMSQDFMN